MTAEKEATAGTAGALVVTLPSDREILLTRSFDAPRTLVFDAWTRPEHVKQWFGLYSDTMSVCEIDLRVGGAWRYIMLNSNGSEMGMKGVYHEIVPHERLVYTEIFDEFEEMGEALVTMTLEENNGRTTISTLVLSPSKQVRDAVIASGMESGAAETYDRLEQHLATIAK